MESVGVAGKLLAQAVVVLLTLGLLQQLGVAFRDDLLQVAPRVLQRLHGEPGVRIGAHLEALDVSIQRRQRLKVHLRRRQRSLLLFQADAQLVQLSLLADAFIQIARKLETR